MSQRSLFLSYKRGPAVTPAAKRLYDRLRVQAADIEVFFDQTSIDAGNEWAPAIDDFMVRATHFVAFISIDYWLSPQCRRELDLALARYEACPKPPPPRVPRLLFVLIDKLDPNDLALDVATARAKVENMRDAADRVHRIGQINFLGPYDAARRLVRLKLESETLYDDQLADMVAAVKAL